MGVMNYFTGLYVRLQDDEEGLALTEYLILLGLLTAVVIAAVLFFGEQLGIKWGTWATWIKGLSGAPASTYTGSF